MHAPLDHFTRGCELAELARYADALSEFEKAEDTYECRWNMAQTLLCLGRYADGFRFNAIRFRLLPRLLTHDAYAVRDEVRAWQGESLMGRHIVLLHEQGLGDGVLLFRYVAELRERGAKVSLLLPDELKRIGSWLAPLYSGGADYCAAMFDVPMFLATTPRSVPDSNITVPEELMEKWRQRLPEGAVGVAWAAKNSDPARSIDLRTFLRISGLSGRKLVSLQTNETAEARMANVVVPGAKNVADVAAIASLMDEVVAVDTLALNVAGAICHPRVTALLPLNCNWKWHCGSPWYPLIKLRRQRRAEDWSSLCR